LTEKEHSLSASLSQKKGESFPIALGEIWEGEPFISKQKNTLLGIERGGKELIQGKKMTGGEKSINQNIYISESRRCTRKKRLKERITKKPRA